MPHACDAALERALVEAGSYGISSSVHHLPRFLGVRKQASSLGD
jgi:hypothetical protein